MSELIFTFIGTSSFKLENQEINFSNKFNVSFKNSILKIEKVMNQFNLYGYWINNISLLIGKNSTGKSSIFELISFGENNRKRHLNKTSFFSIYYVEDNIFYFEGSKKYIKDILGSESKINRDFFFSVTDDGKYYEVESSKKPFIKLSYQHLYPNISWNERKYMLKEKNKNILKNVQEDGTVEKVLSFISFSLPQKKVTVSVKQKEGYSNNPNQLLFLYHGDIPENKNELSTYNSIVNSFFSNLHIFENPYKRNTQNKIYGNNTKQYFILRLFEKTVIRLIEGYGGKQIYTNSRKEMQKLEEKKIELLKKIIQFRNEHNYSFDLHDHKFYKDEDLNEKIDFLISVLKSVIPNNFEGGYYNQLYQRLQSFEEIEFNNNYNDMQIEVQESNEKKFKYIKEFAEDYQSFFVIKLQNLSDGELVYFNTFSQIYHEVSNSRFEDIILVLDEPDLNLHPELCRRFIYECIELINKLKTTKVQFIISSHSPFMITDVPRNSVYSIHEINEAQNELKLVNKSFAGNMLDIMSDSFYLDYPIGEFARRKLLESKGHELIRLIECIDDPLLKRLFKNKIENREDV